jgi:hypothetical protein
MVELLRNEGVQLPTRGLTFSFNARCFSMRKSESENGQEGKKNLQEGLTKPMKLGGPGSRSMDVLMSKL